MKTCARAIPASRRIPFQFGKSELIRQSFCFDYVDYAVHVFLADFIGRRLDHDADHRLGAALADKDAAVASECVCCFLDSFYNCRVLSCRLFIFHADIFENLRENRNFISQFSKCLLFLKHYFHEHQ